MKKISQKTITRALLYIRTLDQMIQQKAEFVSSRQMADLTGLTDVQVRKDVSFFGRVGKPRIGYQTRELKEKLEEFVSQNVVHVALFGVGHLGSAILRYPGFHQEKVKLVAAFDTDKKKIGLTLNGVKVYALEQAPKVVKKTHADIGIIAVPKEYSQGTADLMVKSGLEGIVNFSPTTVSVPSKVLVKNIDLTIEFLSLFCDMQR
jgi:redox-sensing transcriptional repressor